MSRRNNSSSPMPNNLKLWKSCSLRQIRAMALCLLCCFKRPPQDLSCLFTAFIHRSQRGKPDVLGPHVPPVLRGFLQGPKHRVHLVTPTQRASRCAPFLLGLGRRTSNTRKRSCSGARDTKRAPKAESGTTQCLSGTKRGTNMV